MKQILLIRRLFFILFILEASKIFPSFRTFVFNPESQISRSRYIKKMFEAQCRKLGISCEMQLFAKSVDFDKIVRIQKPDMAIVASYYFNFKRKEFQWKPIFSGFSGKKSGFKKVLYAKGTKRLRSIRYVSSVALGANAINPEEQKLINSIGRKKIFVITVSKEIDAIIGLALSQVDGAIVSRRTVQLLKRINPKIARPLRPIKTLPTILYPKIVIFPFAKNRENSVREIKKVLQSFKKDLSKGKFFFRYFGVTTFK